jgi:Luciferase-like monooxygenase
VTGVRIRTGVVLPIFQPDAARALAVVARAEVAGVDGAFCYDHLWPIGQPERPALAPFPVLGRVAAITERLVLGTLVARVGLVPDEILVAQFAALDAVAPGRVVAGIGTGDRLSAAENEAYGVTFELADTRRAALRRCVQAVQELGLVAWVGDGAEPTRRIAVEEGAAFNLWNAPLDRVAATASDGEVTWAGPAPAPGGELAPLVASLAVAGATWAVFPWPVDVDELAAAGAAAPAVAGTAAATPRR